MGAGRALWPTRLIGANFREPGLNRTIDLSWLVRTGGPEGTSAMLVCMARTFAPGDRVRW